MPIFGKDTIGVSTFNNGPNYTLSGSKYTLTEIANISKLTLFIRGFASAISHDVQCAIYTDLGAKIAESAIVNLGTSKEPVGWVDFPLATPIQLPPGDYWLCCIANDDMYIAYDADPDPNAQVFFNQRGSLYGDPSTTPPTPAGFPDAISAPFPIPRDVSIYATYTVGPPVAEFTATPSKQVVEQPIVFDASPSEGAIVAYEWDFDGDGVTDAVGKTVSYAFMSAGTFPVTLTVTDSGGLKGSITHTVIIVTIQSVSLVSDANLVVQNATVLFTATAMGSDGNPFAGATVTLRNQNGMVGSPQTTGSTGVVSWSWIATPSGDYGFQAVADSIVSNSVSVSVTAPVACVTNFDCPAGMICVNNECVSHEPCGTGYHWDDSTKSCVSDVVPPPPACFIATAAYGSPFTQELRVLRAFRDNFMLRNKAGQFLVNSYYCLGKYPAEIIRHSEILRLYVRTILSPIVQRLKH
jgi:hypothetical protein